MKRDGQNFDEAVVNKDNPGLMHRHTYLFEDEKLRTYIRLETLNGVQVTQ